MPKFELVIDPPRYIRDLNTCEQATVRARLVSPVCLFFWVDFHLQFITNCICFISLTWFPVVSWAAEFCCLVDVRGYDVLLLFRYIFGKPVTGKLTVNMTVNGVGYYQHEMGHPVIKNMEVSLIISW